MKTANCLLMTAGDMSGSLNSDPFRVENMSIVAVQAVWTGSSPTGTFKLQASCDIGVDTNSGPSGITGITNWTDVANSAQAITASGDHMWDIDSPGYKWLRVVYTRTSGTGTLAIRVNAKGE